eukprot:3967512-Pleurochrysis_carterae.AAC.1
MSACHALARRVFSQRSKSPGHALSQMHLNYALRYTRWRLALRESKVHLDAVPLECTEVISVRSVCQTDDALESARAEPTRNVQSKPAPMANMDVL